MLLDDPGIFGDRQVNVLMLNLDLDERGDGW